MSSLTEQLKALRHGTASPRPEWVAESRTRLLDQIKNTVASPESLAPNRWVENIWTRLSVFLPRNLVFNVIRPVAVLLIAALVGTSGWIASVDASYQAEPGDFSYSVLRAAQKTQVAVAALIGDKNTETKLHVQFAKNIASKTRQLSLGGSPKKAAKLAVAVADLKSEINSISDKLDETNAGAKADKLPANVAKDVKQNTEQIKIVLQDVKNDLLINSSTPGSVKLAEEVSETKDLVKDVSVKAAEVMVAQHLEGDKTVSASEVKRELVSTLAAAATEVGESKQTVEGVKTSLESVKSELKELVDADKSKTGGATGATTTAIVAKLSDVASAAKQAAVEASVVSAVLDQKISAAQTLLAGTSTGAFASVVDTIKQVNQATKEAEKISDNTIKQVQSVLPTVPITGATTTVSLNSILNSGAAPSSTSAATGSPAAATTSAVKK